MLVVTFLSTLLLELEQAILAGVALSLVVYLYRTSHPSILVRVPNPENSGRKFVTDPSLPECPQARFIRFDGSMFFGAVNVLQDALRSFEEEAPDQKHLALIMSGVNFIDIAGTEALSQIADKFKARGGCLYLIRAKDKVLTQMKRAGSIDIIGESNIFHSKTDAIRTIYRRINQEKCKSCKLNVFVECVRRGRQEPLEDGIS